MIEHQIHDAIGEISEDLIDPVAKLRQKKRYPAVKWAAVAACLCLVASFSLSLVGKHDLKMESTNFAGAPEVEMENMQSALLDKADGTADTATGTTFRAKVLEANEQQVLVMPLEGEQERLCSDKIYVTFGKLAQIPQMQAGDILQIHYDGMIQETYPAQINGTYAIEIIE